MRLLGSTPVLRRPPPQVRQIVVKNSPIPEKVLSLADFHPYQQRAVEHCVNNDRSMLWLQMGLGKTTVVLTAIKDLIGQLRTYRALVIAPRRVAESVWRQEVWKWSHLHKLKVCLLRGSREEMIRNLHTPSWDVHVINYEAIPWLVRQVNNDFLRKGRYPPWSMLVLDEVDRFKNASGKRYQMLQPLLPYFSQRIGMTGTPADNGYLDLHGQYLAIDDGARLCQHVSEFRARWCTSTATTYQSWELKPDAKTAIESRIQDITLSMNADDYLKLPDYQIHDHWLDLPDHLQASYDTLENELFACLDRHESDPIDGEWTLEVSNATAARTKCRQFANGAILVPGASHHEPAALVHDLKLEVLDSILHEANGNPVLVSYLYRSDRDRILERYRKQGYRCAYIGPGVGDQEMIEILDNWNQGRYHLLTSNPASIGHGVNAQHGGHEIVWFGLTDNLRFYRQFNARLRRQGQTAPNVHIRRIMVRNTVEEAIGQLLETKTATAEELRRAIEAYRAEKTGHRATLAA